MTAISEGRAGAVRGDGLGGREQGSGIQCERDVVVGRIRPLLSAGVVNLGQEFEGNLVSQL